MYRCFFDSVPINDLASRSLLFFGKMAMTPQNGFTDESIYQSSRWHPSHITYRFGRAIALHPLLVISLNMLGVFLFGGYFMNNYFILGDLAQLWSPYDSKALSSFEGISDIVSKQQDHLISTILVEHQNKGENVLTVDIFDKLWSLQAG